MCSLENYFLTLVSVRERRFVWVSCSESIIWMAASSTGRRLSLVNAAAAFFPCDTAAIVFISIRISIKFGLCRKSFIFSGRAVVRARSRKSYAKAGRRGEDPATRHSSASLTINIRRWPENYSHHLADKRQSKRTRTTGRICPLRAASFAFGRAPSSISALCKWS